MKFKAWTFVFFVGLLTACSSDETGTTLPVGNTYLPLTTGNSWTYVNSQNNENEKASQEKETITVSSTTIENGTTYYDLTTNASATAGLITSIFSKGKLAKINEKLVYSGNYKINIPELNPIEIPMESVTVYSNYEPAGTELTRFSNAVEQEVEIKGETIPVSINYTIRTMNANFYPTYKVGEKEFKDVLQANFLMTISINAQIGPVQMVLLGEQKVVSIKNYYANEVGLIFSDVNIQYEFDDLSNFGVPKIPDVHFKSSQSIDKYLIKSSNL